MFASDQPLNGRRLSSAAIAFLGIAFCLWNLYLISLLIYFLKGNDFSRMYQTAAAFWQGGEMYGWNAAVPARLTTGEQINLWNMNPPHFHLIMLPFALLPWKIGLFFWLLAGGLCLLVSVRLVLHEVGVTMSPRARELAIVGVLGFSGTTTVVSTGQLTFLLLLPVTLAWLEARRGNWVRCGLYLGVCMSVKPFLLLVWAYLVIARRWKAAGAAIAAAAGCFALGVLVFGVRNHLMWVEGLRSVENWGWLPMNASLQGMLLRSFTATRFFEPAALVDPARLRLVLLGISGLMAVATLFVSARDTTVAGVDRAFALLLVASILLCPLGWAYYFWLPAGPLFAMLIGDSRDGGGEEAPTDPTRRKRAHRLLWIALAGVFFQLPLTLAFQPNPLATLTLGNFYFWTLLGIWGGLILLPSHRLSPQSA